MLSNQRLFNPEISTIDSFDWIANLNRLFIRRDADIGDERCWICGRRVHADDWVMYGFGIGSDYKTHTAHRTCNDLLNRMSLATLRTWIQVSNNFWLDRDYDLMLMLAEAGIDNPSNAVLAIARLERMKPRQPHM